MLYIVPDARHWTALLREDAPEEQVAPVILPRRLEGRIKGYTPKSLKERDVPMPAGLIPHLSEPIREKTREARVFTGPTGGRTNGSNARRAARWDDLNFISAL